MGDAPGSASGTIILPGQGTPPAGAPPAGTAPAFSIPDAYKDRPYLKGVDSVDKVYEMLDGSQKLLGQRPAGIPAPDAKPEEWNKFYDAAGRPKTAAEYQFELDPAIKADDKVIGKVKDLMHKHGLNINQAKGLQKDFDAMAIEMAKEKGIQVQEQNTNFDKLAKDVFGADRDKALATAKGLIDTFTPPAMKGEVAKLSNENLVILAGILNGIHAKYIKTDGAPPGPGNGSGGETPETLRAQARALMASKAYTDSMDAEHMNVRKQVDELYRRASGVNK